MPDDDEPNLLTRIVDWFKEAHEWVEENLGDPAIAAAIRDDLGLEPGEDVDTGAFGAWPSEDFDPDDAAFAETVAEVTTAIQALVQLGEAIGDESVDGWDVAWVIGTIAASDSLRVRVPLVYALAKALLFVSDDPEELEALDPERVVAVLTGEVPEGGSEVALHRVTFGSWLVLVALGELAELLGLELDAYTGWDPDPALADPTGDLVSARAITLGFGLGDDDPAARLLLTFLGVPSDHGGPGLFLSLGGSLELEQEVGNATLELTAAIPSALDLFLPWGDSPHDVTAGTGSSGFLSFDALIGGEDTVALRLGEPEGTRLDVARMLFGLELEPDRGGIRLGVHDAELVVVLGEGDGFLGALPGSEIRVGFELVVVMDQDGLRVEGGTLARATLPINASVFGVFTVHHLEIVLGPSTARDVALDLAGSVTLALGPFQASVDRIGFRLDVAIAEGNLGFLDVDFGFKPPNGIGLQLDAGAVRGGGYLFIDHERGEYAGALELTFGSIGLKAIGVLTTKMPDGSDGWALLLLVYANFPAIQLGFGFVLTGVGGMIGLQHAVNIDALQDGLRDGVLDDVLFPEDPVADAPRIINRLRTVFPVTSRALTFGPMFELGWGSPEPLMTVRLGIVVQLDDVIGAGSGDVALGSISVLGQVKLVIPHEDASVIRMTVDFFGYYDVAGQRLGFVARLRDSKIMEAIELSGMLVVQVQFGDHASFVLAAGGFHPRFEDLPEGLPAKIDRLSIKKKIEVVELKIEVYFAVTPATVQVGAKASLKARLGPVEISGHLGFDAIFVFDPAFRFEIDLSIGVAVKFKGHSLLSVGVDMTLAGPQQWRAKGVVKFSILFWDIEKSFDTSSGTEQPAVEGSEDVIARVAQALGDAGSWTAQLPAGGEAVVTLGELEGVTGLLAHPLGELGVRQKVAPLGLELDRFGGVGVEGPRQIEIQQVRLGAEEVTPRSLRDAFARSQFVDMTAEEKLTSPSFEQFDSGVAVSSTGFTPAPTDTVGRLDYETFELEPRPKLHLAAMVPLAIVATTSTGAVTGQARHGAAGRSVLRNKERMRPDGLLGLTVTGPLLALADEVTLAPSGSLAGAAVTATALATQQAATMPGTRVVEAFELQGVG